MKGYWIALYKKLISENLKNMLQKLTAIIKSYGGKPLLEVENIILRR